MRAFAARALPAAAAALLLSLLPFLEARGAGLALFGRELPPLCPAAWAGAACPGCGTTRAAVALLQLDFDAAWRFHPGVYLLALVPLIAGMRPWLGARRHALARVSAAAAFLATAVLRFLLN